MRRCAAGEGASAGQVWYTSLSTIGGFALDTGGEVAYASVAGAVNRTRGPGHIFSMAPLLWRRENR
jgi:hypothetical protein